MVSITKSQNNNLSEEKKAGTHRQRGRPPKYPKHVVE